MIKHLKQINNEKLLTTTVTQDTSKSKQHLRINGQVRRRKLKFIIIYEIHNMLKGNRISASARDEATFLQNLKNNNNTYTHTIQKPY